MNGLPRRLRLLAKTTKTDIVRLLAKTANTDIVLVLAMTAKTDIVLVLAMTTLRLREPAQRAWRTMGRAEFVDCHAHCVHSQ